MVSCWNSSLRIAYIKNDIQNKKKIEKLPTTYSTLKPKIDSITKCVYFHPLVCHHCNLQQLNLLLDYQDTTSNIRSLAWDTSYKVILYNIVVLKNLDFLFSFLARLLYNWKKYIKIIIIPYPSLHMKILNPL